LKENGYRVLDTTKNLYLFVMDALYTDLKTREEYAKELSVLNGLIARALDQLKKDPQEYFSTINIYFKYKDVNEFLKSLESIQWIYDDRTSELMQQLESHQIPTEHIMEPSDEF